MNNWGDKGQFRVLTMMREEDRGRFCVLIKSTETRETRAGDKGGDKGTVLLSPFSLTFSDCSVIVN